MAGISDSLSAIMTMDGAIACALADHDSGMTLGTAGGGNDFDIELAAAGNTGVVRSKLSVMNSLKIKGGIEDVLITLEKQYHLVRPLKEHSQLFLYVVLDRSKANLALARHKLAAIESDLDV